MFDGVTLLSESDNIARNDYAATDQAVFSVNQAIYSDPFASVTGSAITTDAHRTRSVALGDVDGDGDLDIFVANYADMRRFMVELEQRGLKPRSIQRKLASLRSFFRFLREQRGHSIDPAKLSGAPFLRPAFHANRRKALRFMATEAGKIIDKLARKKS